jgi:F-type H+-transporting ATPase subunit epsilon
MPMDMTLEILTPDGLAFRGPVDGVTIPGTDGEFGVLKGHAPLIGSVGIGTLSIAKNNKKTFYAVNTGYVKVSPTHATMLVETAERADAIDLQRAELARRRAEEKIHMLSRDAVKFEEARIALMRAIARINTSGKK